MLSSFVGAVENYRKLSQIAICRLGGIFRVGVGGSAVAGDVEVDRRCASGYSPFAATVDEGNGRGVFADESMAVTVFFYIFACADRDIAIVPFRGIIYVSDAKAVREQIIGHRVVSRRCVRAVNCYGIFHNSGVRIVIRVNIKIIIVGLFRGRIY